MLRKKGFISNISMLAGGTAIAQLILVASSPLLSRLYTPAEFGAFAVFTSVISVLAVIASMRYELGIPLPEKDCTALNVFVIAVAFIVVTTAITLVVVSLVGDQFVMWAGVPNLLPYLWLIPFGLISFALSQTLTYWNTRANQFSLLKHSRIIQALGIVSIQITGGIFQMGVLSLMIGFSAGRILGFGFLLSKSKFPRNCINCVTLRDAAKRYRRFPIYTTGASLINVVGIQAAPIIITRYFSMGEAGFFALATRILSLPTALIGQAVGQVFFPMMAKEELKKPGSTTFLVEQTATLLLKIGFPVFSIVFLLGPDLFGFVFGESWKEAGRYAQYISPWLLFSFISSPLSTFVLVKEKQGHAFLLTLYETTLRMGALLIGSTLDSVELAVKLYAGAGTIISLVYISWVLHLSGSNLIAWLLQQKKFFLVTILLLPCLFRLNSILPFHEAMIVSAASLGCFSFWTVRNTLRTMANA